MDCFHAKELIQEKLEGELDAQLAHELKAHLVTCHKCRDFEQGIEVLNTLMSREPLESAPEGFSARVIDAASRRRRRVLTYERRNLRVAAACVAAALVIAAILPFFIVLPEASALTEKIAAITPAIPDTAQLAGGLAEIAPPVPTSAPTAADAVQGIHTTWDTLSGIEFPVLGFSGALILILAAFAAAAVALEAVYLALPVRRRK